MTELAALNIKITGDSRELTAAVNVAEAELKGLQSTMTQTQARAGGMGGALGGMAQRMGGARGQIQNVSFQLQDMAVQLSAGTAASVVFAQQGSQIASAFGPVGAVIGTLAAVGIPLLAYAFSSATEEAERLKDAADAQAESLENLRSATERLRLERQMIASGALLEDEQIQLNRIAELTERRADAQDRLNRLVTIGGRATAFAEEAKAKRDALQAEIASIDAELRSLNLERAKKTAVETTKAAQLEVQRIMNQLANANISGPWQRVIGSIQAAIEKAGEYARTAGFGMTTGNANWAKGQMGFTKPGAELLPPGQIGGGGGGGGGGGAATNPIQQELEQIQQSLLTQEQLQMESFARQQEVLNQALQQRLITQQEYQTLMEAASDQHFKTMAASSNNGATAILGALGGLFEGNQKVGAGIALINTMIGASEELKKGTFGIASALRVTGQGMAFVRAIKGASKSGATPSAGATASAAAPPQQNVQTLNLTFQNDPLGISQNFARQLAAMLNEATRNGSTLLRVGVN